LLSHLPGKSGQKHSSNPKSTIWQKSRSSASASWDSRWQGIWLTKGGHEVTVYNRTAAKSKAWAEKFGGRAAA
jgi:hypothetical protein